MTTKTKAAVTKGECSRQKIVETAAVLFNQKGFSGCSMGDIVAASGLEKGTLYGLHSTYVSWLKTEHTSADIRKESK